METEQVVKLIETNGEFRALFNLDNEQLSTLILGTWDRPVFFGKEIAEFLGFKNSKDALQRHVKPKHKTTLSKVLGERKESDTKEEVGCNSQPTSTPLNQPISYNEGKQIMLYEPGLYSLAMHSRLSRAETFRDKICEVILPELRKYGQVSLQNKLEEERRSRHELEHRLDIEHKFNLKLKSRVVTMKAKEKNQIVYIATSEQYAQRNRFKVGGVKSAHLLKGRLATYNSGRPIGDKIYFCFIVNTTDYRHLEQRIERCVGEHREKADSELYNLHYTAIREVVEYLSERCNVETNKYKGLFEEMVRDTFEKDPIVPEPLVLNGAEFRLTQDLTQRVDWDILEEGEKTQFVTSMFDEFLKSEPIDAIQRKRFEQFLAIQGTKFNKRTMWTALKTVARERKIPVKY